MALRAARTQQASVSSARWSNTNRQVRISSVQQRSLSKRHNATKAASFAAYPSNVGILAMDAYFPRTFVKQSELESYDKVGKGKYTIGLEQDTMAFVDDREDIYSMSLTVVQSLMDKFNISYKDIGRLEVGTETVLDKSKSIKTVLMQLFQKSGNYDVEGIDTINACYGGTSALLNAINWVESSSWDGRYALVVCGDIAVYAPGNARPTGGSGMVAMLVGKDAPIIIERGLRGTHMEHVYDFYKPNMESEYPLVDGHLSIGCYFRALDGCYGIYKNKFQALHNQPFSVDNADYAIFHSPYMKLVRKSFARLFYLDAIDSRIQNPKYASIPAEIKTLTPEESYNHKDLQKIFGDLSNADYTKKIEPANLLPKQLGNSYTASMYTGLLSLISTKQNELLGKRILMFSYGSGMAATMYSLKTVAPVAQIAEKADIINRLNNRVAVAPDAYSEVMKLREKTHSAANYAPVSNSTPLFPGTFVLKNVDNEKRRYYERV